jgi:hypothetical protein
MAYGMAFAGGGASKGEGAHGTSAKTIVEDKKAVKPGTAAKSSPNMKAPGPGRMQVEEPNGSAPMGSARESKAWQKNHARGLTDAQKQAFRERKESMEGMIAVIKEKRKAMRDAKPEERAALARELHSLILEKDAGSGPSVTASARLGMDNSASQEVKATVSAAKDLKEEEKKEAAELRRKRIEDNQSQMKKNEEERKLQLEKLKQSLDNGKHKGTGGSQIDEDD